MQGSEDSWLGPRRTSRIAYWASLERSQVWGPFVDAALNCKFEVMRKLPEIVKVERGSGRVLQVFVRSTIPILKTNQ